MTSTPRSRPTADVTFHVRTPEDLLAAAPVVLGFHPEDSVVMMAFEGAQPFHGRAPLPPRSSSREDAAVVSAQLVGPAWRNGIRGIALVFFSDDEVTVRRVWSVLRADAASAGIRVQAALRADGRRYYPLLGGAALRERGVAYDVSSHPFLAQAVLHGLVVERDRAAVEASVGAAPTRQRDVEAALARAGLGDRDPPATAAERRRWGEWARALVGRHARARTPPADDELARLAWAVQDLRVRDAAWELITRPGAREHVELWLGIVRRVPDRLVAAPAALLGWAAWQAGNGALAWVAVDRCREVDPGYGMAAILARCLEQAIPPDALDRPFAWDEGLPA